MRKTLKRLLLVLLMLCIMAACAAFAEENQERLGGTGADPEGEHARVTDYSFSVSASSLQYGMHLYDSVLDASGSTVTLDGQTVPAESVGSFLWRNRMTVPDVGENLYAVYFVPNEDLGTSFNDMQVSVRVNKARPVIVAPPAASSLLCGQSLSQSALSGGAAANPHNGEMEPVQGVFEWELKDLVPSVGTQQETVVFTPIINAADRYETVYFSVPVEVMKQRAEMSVYPTPSRNLKYGETLSAVSLTGGTASDDFGQNVPGTCVFEEDRVLPVGTHTVNALFVPLDHVHWESIRFSVQVTVEKASPAVNVQSVNMTYGQSLGELNLQGTAADAQGNPVEGTFAFADGSRKPAVSESGTFDAVFTPADQSNYLQTPCAVQVTVHKAQLLLQWNDNMKYAGMQDGVYRYSVSGLPEGTVLSGNAHREAGEAAGEYTLYADGLSLPEELSENYILIKENGTFRIEEIALSAIASVRGEQNENGWYASAAQLVAPAGHTVSFSRSGDFQAELALPESASGADYYLRVEDGEYAGAVGGPFRASYRLDVTPPDIELTVLDGNEFVLTARDAVSGVDRIYGIFEGPAKACQGALEAEYAYAAREAGNYTYVVHDVAGHTAAVTVEFPDTDGDGLVDAYEQRTGTAVDSGDTDGDGIGDFDARKIRNLLGYERLQVSGAALLGLVTDESERTCVLPEESMGILVPDESFALRSMAHTFRGVMRVNTAGIYGFSGDLMWYRDSAETTYTALHAENLAGRFALSPHAPGGLMALAEYEDGKTLKPVLLADMVQGRVFALAGTEGAERFDLSPDGTLFAWLKAGTAYLADVQSGNVILEAPLEARYVFQFDAAGRLVTDEGCFVPDDGAWKKESDVLPGAALYTAQCLRGESRLLIYGGEDESYLLKCEGTAELENEAVVRTLRAALLKADAAFNWADAIAELEKLPVSDEVTLDGALYAVDER